MTQNHDSEFQDLEFEDQSKTHFTVIPNFLHDIGLDSFTGWAYSFFKRIAGDKGACFRTSNSICKHLNIGMTKLREIKKELSKPRPELGGIALIKIIKRSHPTKGTLPDLIQMTDLWTVNAEIICGKRILQIPEKIINNEVKKTKKARKTSSENEEGGGSPNEGGGARQTRGGGSPNEHKEEQREEELSVKKDSETENTETLEDSFPDSLASLPLSKKDNKAASSKGKKTDWSKSLAEEEKEFHDLAVGYNPPIGEKLESAFITAEIKKYGLEKMKQAFDFCLHTIRTSGIKSSMGGVFRNALKKDLQAPTEGFAKCKKLSLEAKEFCKKFHVTEKYISLPEQQWELYYSNNYDSFREALIQKVNTIKGR